LGKTAVDRTVGGWGRGFPGVRSPYPSGGIIVISLMISHGQMHIKSSLRTEDGDRRHRDHALTITIIGPVDFLSKCAIKIRAVWVSSQRWRRQLGFCPIPVWILESGLTRSM
jgi:hypothetical protein